MRKSIQELVRLDLVHREQLGQERYGTSLHAYNGREAILDAYEEALDLCCYLRQVIEELTTIDPQTAVQPAPSGAPGTTAHEPAQWRASRKHAKDECGWYCTHDPITEDS